MIKILVVDDSPTVRQQVILALSAGGFEVLEATDGLDGLRVIGIHSDLSAVILDVNMPGMGGLEMLEQVRTSEANRSLPVIMLTTEGQQSLIERAKRAGARGWVVKPFKPELLLGAIRKLTAATTPSKLAPAAASRVGVEKAREVGR